MPKRISIRVVPEGGVAFEANFSNLTAQSLFLETAEPLPFRTRLTVHLFDHDIPGEVIHHANDPSGVVVLLQPDDAARVVLEDAGRATEDVFVSKVGENAGGFDRLPTQELHPPIATLTEDEYEEPTNRGSKVPREIAEASDDAREAQRVKLRATTLVGELEQPFVDEDTEDVVPLSVESQSAAD